MLFYDVSIFYCLLLGPVKIRELEGGLRGLIYYFWFDIIALKLVLPSDYYCFFFASRMEWFLPVALLQNLMFVSAQDISVLDFNTIRFFLIIRREKFVENGTEFFTNAHYLLNQFLRLIISQCSKINRRVDHITDFLNVY